MNIVFFAHFAGSPHHGMVYGHYYLAREWIQEGHQVTIIAAAFAHTRINQPECNHFPCEEWIDGIRYIWIKTRPYLPANHLGRVLNILGFTWQLLAKPHLIDHADLIICSSHHPFAIIPAHRFAKRFNARLVFEVRDLWPLTLIELGGTTRHNPFIRAMQWAENYAYRSADFVVSVLSNSSSYMEKHGMQANKFIYIPNGIVDIDEIKKPLFSNHAAQIAAAKNNGFFLVGYAGRIGLANALHTLIESLTLLTDLPIKIVILGDGSHRSQLMEQTQSLELTNKVIFLDSVEKSQVNAFLEQLDAVYLGLQNSPLFSYGISPTKLNDYMLSAKPIIYAVNAPPFIVEESGCGFTCQAEDHISVADCIRKLYTLTPEARRKMGVNGRNWLLENRDYKVLAQQFLESVAK